MQNATEAREGWITKRDDHLASAERWANEADRATHKDDIAARTALADMHTNLASHYERRIIAAETIARIHADLTAKSAVISDVGT